MMKLPALILSLCSLLMLASIPAFAQQAPAHDFVATVNGQGITRHLFELRLKSYAFSDDDVQAKHPIGYSLLRQMINEALIEQLAAEQGLTPTDAEINTSYQSLVLWSEISDVKPFEQAMHEGGWSVDDLKDANIRPLVAQVNLLTKGMPPVTEAEIEANYAQRQASFYTIPHSAHIKHILLASKAAAVRVYALIQRGQPFDKFVNHSHRLRYYEPDGDEPRWVHLDQPDHAIVPAGLVRLIRDSKPGNVIPPYADRNEYWIVQVVEIRPKEVLPLDKVRDFVRLDVLGAKSVQDADRLNSYRDKLFTDRHHARIRDS